METNDLPKKNLSQLAIDTVYEALEVLKSKPHKRWNLRSSIADVISPELDSRLNALGINFQVVLNNGIGVALEVIDPNGSSCAKKNGRGSTIKFLIEKVQVFMDDIVGDTLSKVIRRVVQSINRVLNILNRKEQRRKHWKSMREIGLKCPYFHKSQTLVIPRFTIRGDQQLIRV